MSKFDPIFKYHEYKKLCFSKLFSNTYLFTDTFEDDPSDLDVRTIECRRSFESDNYVMQGNNCPIFNLIESDDLYYGKFVNSNNIHANSYLTNHLLNKDGFDLILTWPKDIIELNYRIDKDRLAFVNTDYFLSLNDNSIREDRQEVVLFPYSDLGNEKRNSKWCFHNLLYSDNVSSTYTSFFNYNNKKILDMVYALLVSFKSLNSMNCYYLDFNLHKFYYINDKVFFDYSNLIYYDDKVSDDKKVNFEDFPIEFMHPYFTKMMLVDGLSYKGSIKYLQNFSLTALIFYLFYGFYPYEGILSLNSSETSLEQHNIKFTDISKGVDFVFDGEANAPRHEIYDNVKKLWDDTPKAIRDIFSKTFIYYWDIQYSYYDFALEPGQWIDLLKEHGWVM